MYPALFQVLLPQALPQRGRRRSAAALAWASACQAWRERAHEAGAAARLAAMLAAHAPAAQAAPARLEHEGEAIHDAFFHVGRIATSDAPLAFATTCAQAVLVLLQECSEAPTRLCPGRLQALADALIDGANGTSRPSARPGEPIAFEPPADAPVHAMRRWRRGHQVFAVLTQALIVELERLSAAVWAAAADGRGEPARVVRRLVALLDAACTTLELTGDFPAGDYQTLIRPLMMPPHLPESFSGLLSADHRVFVFRLRSMAPELEALRLSAPGLHADLHAALGRVYDSHRFVCERFVGDAPSLRATGDAAHGGAKIEKYKAARLRVFAPPAQPRERSSA